MRIFLRIENCDILFVSGWKMQFQRVLTVFVFLFVCGIQGQLEDFMKICDLCHRASLQDCNSTNIFPINMTINCEMTEKMCSLGINEDFEGFEDQTLSSIDERHICIFKDLCKNNTSDNVSADNYGVEIVNNNIDFDEEEIHSTENISPEPIDQQKRESPTTGSPEEISSERTPSLELPDNDFTTFRSNSSASTSVTTENSDMSHDEPADHIDSVKSARDLAIATVACFACDSSVNDACLGRIDELKTVECPKEIGCVSYHLNGSIVRNCASEISPLEIDLCRKPTNQTCDLCQSAACNNKPWKECFQCNSLDDLNCALWTNAEKVSFGVCPNYDDNCLVRITDSGHTLRECARPDVKCLPDEICQICEGPLCNAGIYPPDRIQCLQCHGCDEAQNQNDALPCPIYNVDRKCFAAVSIKGKMLRGCLTDLTQREMCLNIGPKCIMCNEENGCNSIPLMKEPSLSCSKCKSRNNPECLWHQPETSISKCVQKYLFYLNETCLTQYDPATEAVVRDCSMDYGVCTSEDVDCKMCPENGCNRDGLKVQQCIACQSDLPGQIECKNEAAGMQSTKCPKENLTVENRGCYTMNKGNVTHRGCVVDLSNDDLKLCNKKPKASCEICVEDLCNNILAPSLGSKTLKFQMLAMLGLIFVLSVL